MVAKLVKKQTINFKEIIMTDIFKTLNAIDVNSYLKTKFKFKFLPWMSALTIVKNIYPNSYYEVQKFDNKPYLFDEQLGYMIFTKITINDNCLECWLPVMDYSNKAMKHVKYNYKDNRQIEKTVESATMFDINTSIMRCLVKNIAMHGLGSYVYVGDDLPFEFDNNLLKSANDIKIENKKKKLIQ